MSTKHQNSMAIDHHRELSTAPDGTRQPTKKLLCKSCYYHNKWQMETALLEYCDRGSAEPLKAKQVACKHFLKRRPV